MITPGQVKSKARVSEFFRLTRFCEDGHLHFFVFARLRAISVLREGCHVRTRPRCDRKLVAHNARLTGSPTRDPVSYSGRILGVQIGQLASLSSDLQSQAPTHRHVQLGARIGSTRAAHPASAAWCSITTRRGGARLSQLACLPLCSMANWP